MYKRQMSFLLFLMISLGFGSIFASASSARTVGDSDNDQIFKMILAINGFDLQEKLVGHFQLMCDPKREPGKDVFVVIDRRGIKPKYLPFGIKQASCAHNSAQQQPASHISVSDVAGDVCHEFDGTPQGVESFEPATEEASRANNEQITKIPLTLQDLEGLGLGDDIYNEHGLIPPSTLCQEACNAVLTGCAIGMGISAAAAAYGTVAKP